MLVPEIIRRKRDGHALLSREIEHFVAGLVAGTWSDSQAAAMAMAIVCRGMSGEETAVLTQAMTRSGERLSWVDKGLDGPVLDKHSTGGVGDKVSLILAPLVAACGGFVPMISGRGLGHTGGTLDKLEALPGYRVEPDEAQLLHTLRISGCAIVGASSKLAPADRRLYAIRDITATVESVALITASILSKKLAAGLQGLVMDVKTGPGAFTPTLDAARELARSLVQVASASGLPTVALLTDMSQPLGWTAGNALEVDEALQFLTGAAQHPRLREVTLALAAEMLCLGGLAADTETAHERADKALSSGAAAERFARMVAALGGPHDVLQRPQLPVAPVRRPVPAPRAGWVSAIHTRSLGVQVLELGGGRLAPQQAVDARVGLAALKGLGERVQAGESLAIVHACSEQSALQAIQGVQRAYTLGEAAPGGPVASPLLERLAAR